MEEKTKIPIVDIGVACYGSQSPRWWTRVFADLLSDNRIHYEINEIHTASSMLKDDNKNGIIEQKSRTHFTDVNRVAVTEGFLHSRAEWIFWLDDDTIPPQHALTHLINLKRQFVSGLYFLPAPPFNPIAYMRNEDRTYSALYNYPEGALVEVDSVGMGCALVHKEVYLKIKENHEVFKRPNGSLLVIHKDKVKDHKPFTGRTSEYIERGMLHMPVYKLSEGDTRSFPWYQLEYVRTEDHHFCELAGSVGIRPWLETNVVCEHIKDKGYGKEDYLANLQEGSKAAAEGAI